MVHLPKKPIEAKYAGSSLQRSPREKNQSTALTRIATERQQAGIKKMTPAVPIKDWSDDLEGETHQKSARSLSATAAMPPSGWPRPPPSETCSLTFGG
jgi:hypothetical protein